MFKIRLFTLVTCLTLSGGVLPSFALDLSTALNNSFNNSKASLDPFSLNLNKTRPEFTQPDLRNPIPLINSSPSPSPASNSSPSPTPSNNTSPANNANPSSTPNPTVSPSISPLVPANPLPSAGTGIQGLGDRPITPTINTLPGANRPEFQVPDLLLPRSPTPSPAP